MSGGGRFYVSSNSKDERAAYWWMRQALNAAYRSYDLPAGTGTAYFPIVIPYAPCPILPNGKINWYALDPTSYGGNPMIEAAAMNPSLAPPAGDPDYTLTCNWAANSAMQSSGTLTTGASTLLRLTTGGVILDSASQAPDLYPIYGTDSQTPTVQSGLGFQYQIPTGFNYRSTGIMTVVGANPADLRSNGYGSNTLASEIAIKLFDGAPRLNMKFWDFVRDSQAHFNVADDNSDAPNGALVKGTSGTANAANMGVGFIDWREQSRTKQIAGMKLVGKDLGSANINWTDDVATNASLVYFHQRFLSYTGR